jgi:hypothetical protein
MNAVALSYLLPCWVNRDTGYPQRPYSSGAVRHVVRVGPNPAMPVVLEFSDGGRFEHEDCAPASIQSRLREQGIVTTVDEIETLAGTSLSGTGFPGCARALQHFGVPAALHYGNPPAGYVMNPMLADVVGEAEFASYLATTQGGYLAAGSYLPTPPPPKPPPPPTPVTPEDSEMYLYQAQNGTIYAIDGGTRLAFQNIADVDVYLAQGYKLFTAAKFSADWNAALLRYPAI